MKTLNTHLLQLTVDGLNHRTMLMDQLSIFAGVAAHIAALFWDQARCPMNVAQLLIFVADITFVSHDRATSGQCTSSDQTGHDYKGYFGVFLGLKFVFSLHILKCPIDFEDAHVRNNAGRKAEIFTNPVERVQRIEKTQLEAFLRGYQLSEYQPQMIFEAEVPEFDVP